jgi:hypothetical protein
MDASAMTTLISKLRTLGLAELQQKYQEVFGKETKSRNRTQLFSQIARKMQDNEEPESAMQPVPLPTLVAKFEPKKKTRSRNVTKTAGKKKAKPDGKRTRVRAIGERDPRLPKPGTTLTREWHGKKYLVKVLDSGFEYGGKPFRSLSAVAKSISGQIVNGYLWFHLTTVEKRVS